MLSILVATILFVFLLIAAIRPKNFIYLIFVVGPLPLFWLEAINSPIGKISMSAVKVQIIIFALLLLIIFSRANKLSASIYNYVWPYLLFLLFCIVSIAWTPDITMAIRMLLKLIAPLLFGIYVYNNFDKIGAKHFIQAVLLSGVIYLIIALASTGFAINKDSYLGVVGTSRAVFSCHMLLVFTMSLSLMLTKYNLKNTLTTIIFAASVVAAFTRITIGGLFLVGGSLMFYKTRGILKIVAPIIGIVALILLFVTVDEFKERMFLESADRIDINTTLSDPSEVVSSIAGSGRFYAWEVSLEQLFYDNKIIGSGIGATQLYFYGSSGANTSAVHSEIVRLLCDVGLIGLMLYVFFWIYTVIKISEKKIRKKLNSEQICLKYASIGMILGYLAFLTTDNGFDYVAQAGIFVFGTCAAYFASMNIRR